MKIIIPKGKHYDFSLSRLWYRFIPFLYKKNKVISFEANILTEPYDIRPDPDQADRHKLFGINLNFWKASNQNSIMVSFQPNPEDNTWDIAAYVNDSGSWVHFAETSSKSGDKIRGEFVLESRRRIRLYIYVNDEKVNYDGYFHTWNNTKVRFPSLILPWHGGKDNDGNGVGGVAPVGIDIELDINKNS